MELFKAVGSLEALAHQTRLGVVRMLIPVGRDGLAAGEIAARLDLPANSLSFHLGRLVNAGLIHCRRRGRNLFYAADYERIDEIVRFLTDKCCADAPQGCFPDCPTPTDALDYQRAANLPGTNPLTRE